MTQQHQTRIYCSLQLPGANYRASDEQRYILAPSVEAAKDAVMAALQQQGFFPGECHLSEGVWRISCKGHVITVWEPVSRQHTQTIRDALEEVFPFTTETT